MKATIDFDDALYRRLKVEAARRGVTIRDLVAQGVRYVLGTPPAVPGEDAKPQWLGALRKYSANAEGRHDLAAVRASIARGRAAKKK